jgi:hypothetical protein
LVRLSLRRSLERLRELFPARQFDFLRQGARRLLRSNTTECEQNALDPASGANSPSLKIGGCHLAWLRAIGRLNRWPAFSQRWSQVRKSINDAPRRE